MMADFRARFKPLFRRSSTATTTTTTTTTTSSNSSANSSPLALGQRRGHSKSSLLLSKQRKSSLPNPVHEEEPPLPLPLPLPHPPGPIPSLDVQSVHNDPPQTPDTSFDTPRLTPVEKINPTLTIEEPTPDLTPAVPENPPVPESNTAPASTLTPAITLRPLPLPRRQSLTNNSQTRFLETLLESEKPDPDAAAAGYFDTGPLTVSAKMLHRKIWVKRPDQSATMVTISEDDLVDDAREVILKKYANSLGRYLDAPDVTLRIQPRDSPHRHAKGAGARTLGPEEQLSRTLDAYYPGGQHVQEALIIDIPRRTPRHSPNVSTQYYAHDDLRPSESGKDYFPTVPVQGQPSPRLPLTIPMSGGPGASHPALPRSMGIVGNGQAPPLPSPSQVGMRHPHGGLRSSRPGYPRRDTASPKVLGLTKTNTHDSLKSQSSTVPAPPPLPSPQIPSEGQPTLDHTATPPRVASPRPGKPRKPKKAVNTNPKLPTGLLDGAVPPINVLIVEDNIINLKLLEAFMKRLKVRWHTAMNGKEAVTKWRQGGFHLVLMDIQLPVMNGLDATKEIRRLERVNKIGVFSNSAASTPTFANSIEGTATGADIKDGLAPDGEDCLMNTGLFKSPVIIVALTASSLQSDRHEALAAGCNDFLTKPVNFVWLERKVMEWGCMQALIDFDGWRKWKDFSQAPQTNVASGKQPSPSGKTALSPTSAKDSAGGANGTPIKGGKKSLMLNTGLGGKKDKRLSPAGETVSSGSGSEGSGNGSTITAGT
ncbi:Two-component response regulator SSK1p [Xanthoria calcicola]